MIALNLNCGRENPAPTNKTPTGFEFPQALYLLFLKAIRYEYIRRRCSIFRKHKIQFYKLFMKAITLLGDPRLGRALVGAHGMRPQG